MPPVVFIAATTDAGGASFGFEVPAAAKPGDVMIAIVAIEDSSPDVGLDDQADFEILAELETTPAASSTGQVFVLRHVITGDESSAGLEIPLDATPTKPAGAALIYRALDPVAAAVASGIVNVVAATSFPSPSGTLTRYSDLYLGIAYASTDDPAITVPAGTTERVNVALGGDRRLAVFDLLPEATGATGTKTATAASAQSGVAASIVLAALPTPSAAATLALDPVGGIGLPTKGV